MIKKITRIISLMVFQVMLLGILSIPTFASTSGATSSIPGETYDFTTLGAEGLNSLIKDGTITVLKENKDNWKIDENGLLLTGVGGPGSGHIGSTTENLFAWNGSGDYIAETSFVADTTSTYDAAANGFVIYQDNSNYLKLANQRNEKWQLTAKKDGELIIETSITIAMQETSSAQKLKVIKKGDTYSFYCALEGDTFKKIGDDIVQTLNEPRLCLYAGAYKVSDGYDAMRATYKTLSIKRNPWTQNYNFKNMTADDIKAIKADGTLEIKNETTTDGSWILTNEGLVITSTGAGELAATKKTYKNMFAFDGSDDYVADSKFIYSGDMNEWADGTSFVIYQDDNTFTKFEYGSNAGGGGRIFMQQFENNEVIAQKVKNNANKSITNGTLWFRISKQDNNYIFYYSFDGSTYVELVSATLVYTNPKICFYTSSFKKGTTISTATTTFEYLNIQRQGNPMKIHQNPIDIKVDETAKLTANLKVTSWASSDENVATVSSSGVVKAVGEGYALIRAIAQDDTSDICVVRVMPKEDRISDREGNPYLPFYEHVPDAEPYVFEDPDNPGQYRIYIYGSHDTETTGWCGTNLVTWSAPIENPTQWRYEGVIYKSNVFEENVNTFLYAPDIAEVVDKNGSKKYYLYPNPMFLPSYGGTVDTRSTDHVAVSDRPDGPFVANEYNVEETGSEVRLSGDPAVFVDDDGSVYAYWQQGWAELDPKTMETLKIGETIHNGLPGKDVIESDTYDPTEWNIVNDPATNDLWRFFEASSIRKIGDKYVYIFARSGLDTEPTGGGSGQLAYGYSDSPKGPWKWGGVIVNCIGETYTTDGTTYNGTFFRGNTHGSLVNVNGTWFITYHRGTGTAGNPWQRVGMADSVKISYDEGISVADGGKVTISTAEMTSKGFAVDGLDPYKKHSAGIVSYIAGNIKYGTTDTKYEITFDTQRESISLNDLHSGTIAGIKYFNMNKLSDSSKNYIDVSLRPHGIDGKINVWLRPDTAVGSAPQMNGNTLTSLGENSFILGTIDITSDMPEEMTTFRLSAEAAEALSGEWGVFFAFESESNESLCDLGTVEFVRDIYVDSLSVDLETDKVSATIGADSDIAATVIFASYDYSNTLIDVEIKNLGISKGTFSYDAGEDFEIENANIVKVMIWNNLNSVVPLCEYKEFVIKK